MQKKDKPTPLVGIVGKSNSGKTTLIEKIITALTGEGYRIATIKHDVHSKVDLDRPGKDTWRHREAGAESVLISSERFIFMTKKVKKEHSLEEIYERYLQDDYDLIIVEGFKRSQIPKIEVHRSERSDSLACDPHGGSLIAVVSDRPWDLEIPVFDIDDWRSVTEFIKMASELS
jgi:molybdopterin-guanine dinucleotide biosynthesis protein B